MFRQLPFFYKAKQTMNIVLYEPEIPYNTGNIGRTCVAANAALHLIRPLGFRLNQKEIQRAGLDYWPKLNLTVYNSYDDFLKKNRDAKIWMATTKAHRIYTEAQYEMDDFLMFGPESRGIPEEILIDHEDTCIRIPMYGDTRSLNLCNSAAIVLYEALRQHRFKGLETEGHLHQLHWKSGLK